MVEELKACPWLSTDYWLFNAGGKSKLEKETSKFSGLNRSTTAYASNAEKL